MLEVMDTPITLLWLRQDLRLADHPALRFAAARGRVVPVYIRDPAEVWPPGAASRWALHHALRSLAQSLSTPLVLRSGDPLAVLRALIKETGATALAMSRLIEPYARTRDGQIEAALQGDGFEVRTFNASLLFEPRDIRTKSGGPFKVYTPFYKACRAAPAPDKPLPAPPKLSGLEGVASESLKDWALVPTRPDWAKGFAKLWPMTEQAAHKRLHTFIDTKLVYYKEARDRPDHEGTSCLSPYLHWGVLSPRQVWAALHHAMAQRPALTRGGEVFGKELLWREFSAHLLYERPELPETPLQPAFAAMPWRRDPAGLKAWQKGQTGFPIVDAGMRQLWQTGWMHNRVRMIVASFLVKDLLLPWTAGESWFWETLIDADLASNAASWQWVAGCGADAAPFFRIFNPVLQGRRFDPDGAYVRRYVPELNGIKGIQCHAPWLLDAAILREAGVVLGKTYPKPLTDHALARARALSALKNCKKP